MSSIFVSIASYRDQELIDTVYSILRQAENPSNIFLSILSQDEDDKHPQLEHIFKIFGVTDYQYNMVHFSESRGACYARAEVQKYLTLDFKYYLQIDSHSQFVDKWDIKLISDYERCREIWGDYIFSSYPGTYEYNHSGNIKTSDSDIPTSIRIQPISDSPIMYEPKYKDYLGKEFGEYHGYFCAGMVFGYSKFFIDVPYDPNLYFNGEEQTLAIRFYCNDIKLIAPPANYLYHHYTGLKRLRHWENNPGWENDDKRGIERLNDFYLGKDLGIYGIKDMQKYHKWIECFVTPRQE